MGLKEAFLTFFVAVKGVFKKGKENEPKNNIHETQLDKKLGFVKKSLRKSKSKKDKENGHNKENEIKTKEQTKPKHDESPKHEQSLIHEQSPKHDQSLTPLKTSNRAYESNLIISNGQKPYEEPNEIKVPLQSSYDWNKKPERCPSSKSSNKLKESHPIISFGLKPEKAEGKQETTAVQPSNSALKPNLKKSEDNDRKESSSAHNWDEKPERDRGSVSSSDSGYDDENPKTKSSTTTNNDKIVNTRAPMHMVSTYRYRPYQDANQKHLSGATVHDYLLNCSNDYEQNQPFPTEYFPNSSLDNSQGFIHNNLCHEYPTPQNNLASQPINCLPNQQCSEQYLQNLAYESQDNWDETCNAQCMSQCNTFDYSYQGIPLLPDVVENQFLPEFLNNENTQSFERTSVNGESSFPEGTGSVVNAEPSVTDLTGNNTLDIINSYQGIPPLPDVVEYQFLPEFLNNENTQSFEHTSVNGESSFPEGTGSVVNAEPSVTDLTGNNTLDIINSYQGIPPLPDLVEHQFLPEFLNNENTQSFERTSVNGESSFPEGTGSVVNAEPSVTDLTGNNTLDITNYPDSGNGQYISDEYMKNFLHKFFNLSPANDDATVPNSTVSSPTSNLDASFYTSLYSSPDPISNISSIDTPSSDAPISSTNCIINPIIHTPSPLPIEHHDKSMKPIENHGKLNKHSLPDYKKYINELCADLPCCQLNYMSCRNFFQPYIKELSGKERLHICLKVLEMDVEKAYEDLHSILYTFWLHSNPGVHCENTQNLVSESYLYACFYEICQRFSMDKEILYRKLFMGPKGLNLLKRAALTCLDRPYLAILFAKCAKKAVKDSLNENQPVLKPIYQETDANGDHLVTYLVKKGPVAAKILYELVDKEQTLFDVNHTNLEGLSALHIACSEYDKNSTNCLEFVHILLYHGRADVRLKKCNTGESPLHLAVQSQTCDLDLILLLFKYIPEKEWGQLAKLTTEIDMVVTSGKGKSNNNTPLSLARSKLKILMENYPKQVVEFLSKCSQKSMNKFSQKSMNKCSQKSMNKCSQKSMNKCSQKSMNKCSQKSMNRT